MSNKSRYDFASWLETKNPNERYEFNNGCGRCLMGQYMTSKGESWDFNLYNLYVKTILGESNVSVLSSQPQSMGAALTRVRALENA